MIKNLYKKIKNIGKKVLLVGGLVGILKNARGCSNGSGSTEGYRKEG